MKKWIRRVKHLFIPGESNNHRSKLLHSEALLFVITFFFACLVLLKSAVILYPTILGFATNITIDDLLTYTNQERQSQGLNTLVLNSALSEAANKKAVDMFAKGYWAHNSPNGQTPWDFIKASGYTYTYAGENLARDFSDSRGVVSAWMNSPSHKDNILRSEYREIGFAIVNGKLNGEDTTLVVQMFGTPKEAIAKSVEAAPKKESAQIAQISIQPTTAISQDVVEQTKIQQSPIVLQGSVVKAKLDYKQVAKNLSFIVLGVFLTVLVLDGVYIWKKKAFRIAGHNLAHLVFLLMILGILVVSARGMIL